MICISSIYTFEKKSFFFNQSIIQMMFCILIIFFVGVGGEKVRFNNYQLLRLFPNNEMQVKILRDLELAGEYDFWTRVGRINGSVDILIPPENQAQFQELIDTQSIFHTVQIQNIQGLIEEELLRVNSRCIDMDWSSYHKLDEVHIVARIENWIDEVAKKYSFVKKFNVGKSYEGRRITALEISFQENTTGVFIESGMHGREWITPAATTWMIKEILESPADSVFRNFTYFYIPVFNPDGYAYSWSHNRLWKKTRSRYKNGSVICYGVDPNRNWDFSWKDFGESENPCSESYPGPFAFSEIEMKSIANYLKCIAHSRDVDIYIAYRGYSQLLHYPWNHEKSLAPQSNLWQRIGEAAADSLREIHGTEYEVESFSEIFEPAGGISSEWYYAMHNSTICYTYEVRDKGDYGFLLPPDEIIPTGEELLLSLETILYEYQQLNITGNVDSR